MTAEWRPGRCRRQRELFLFVEAGAPGFFSAFFLISDALEIKSVPQRWNFVAKLPSRP